MSSGFHLVLSFNGIILGADFREGEIQDVVRDAPNGNLRRLQPALSKTKSLKLWVIPPKPGVSCTLLAQVTRPTKSKYVFYQTCLQNSSALFYGWCQQHKALLPALELLKNMCYGISFSPCLTAPLSKKKKKAFPRNFKGFLKVDITDVANICW